MRCPVALICFFFYKGMSCPKDLLAWCRTLSDLSAVAVPLAMAVPAPESIYDPEVVADARQILSSPDLVVSLSSPTTKELRRQFQEADKDGSGEIDATEVASGLTGCVLKRFFFFFCFLLHLSAEGLCSICAELWRRGISELAATCSNYVRLFECCFNGLHLIGDANRTLWLKLWPWQPWQVTRCWSSFSPSNCHEWGVKSPIVRLNMLRKKKFAKRLNACEIS